MARPRSEEARRKVLDATADLIIEGGVAKVTIEEVASRSRVAKTTIYRHWPDRTSLILDTAQQALRHVDTPDTGSLREDLVTYFGNVVRADLSGRVGRMMPCLIDAASRDPEMEQLRARLGVERQRPIMEIVQRAQDRGELPDDLDPQVVVGAIVGPIVFRKVMQRLPVDATYVASCIDVAIAGLSRRNPPSAVRSAGSTPRRTPSAAFG
jgi:AcrR family transcriptional regulator